MEKVFFDEKSKCDAFDRIAEHFFCKNFGSMQKSEFGFSCFPSTLTGLQYYQKILKIKFLQDAIIIQSRKNSA